MKKLERTGPERIKGGRQKLERQGRPPRGMQWPNFDELFTPLDDNPLDAVELTGDPEEDAKAELNATAGAFMENEKAGLDSYRSMIDPEFYFVVCFQSREQKNEFLEKSGMTAAKMGDKYIDGLRMAKHLNVDVEPIPLQTKAPRKMPRLLRGAKSLR